jgi:cytochrome b6-f complex iron-sulfur subunit
MDEPVFERRRFLRCLPAVPAVLCAGASVVASGCAGANWLVPAQIGGALVVPLSALEPSGGVFVAHPRSNRPIYVARTAPDTWVALHARCTHRGCQPEPVAGRMVCPCHGSEFSMEGEVLEGPAEHPLARFRVALQDGSLRVQIGAAG